MNHFPLRLHDMLDEAEKKGHAHIVSWCDNGTAFKIHDPWEIVPIMGQYFRQTKYKSLLRQLQGYSFTRVTQGLDKGKVSHPEFNRGHRSECVHMKRKLPSKQQQQEAADAVILPAVASYHVSSSASFQGQGGASSQDQDRKINLHHHPSSSFVTTSSSVGVGSTAGEAAVAAAAFSKVPLLSQIHSSYPEPPQQHQHQQLQQRQFCLQSNRLSSMNNYDTNTTMLNIPDSLISASSIDSVASFFSSLPTIDNNNINKPEIIIRGGEGIDEKKQLYSMMNSMQPPLQQPPLLLNRSLFHGSGLNQSQSQQQIIPVLPPSSSYIAIAQLQSNYNSSQVQGLEQAQTQTQTQPFSLHQQQQLQPQPRGMSALRFKIGCSVPSSSLPLTKQNAQSVPSQHHQHYHTQEYHATFPTSVAESTILQQQQHHQQQQQQQQQQQPFHQAKRCRSADRMVPLSSSISTFKNESFSVPHGFVAQPNLIQSTLLDINGSCNSLYLPARVGSNSNSSSSVVGERMEFQQQSNHHHQKQQQQQQGKSFEQLKNFYNTSANNNNINTDTDTHDSNNGGFHHNRLMASNLGTLDLSLPTTITTSTTMKATPSPLPSSSTMSINMSSVMKPREIMPTHIPFIKTVLSPIYSPRIISQQQDQAQEQQDIIKKNNMNPFYNIILCIPLTPLSCSSFPAAAATVAATTPGNGIGGIGMAPFISTSKIAANSEVSDEIDAGIIEVFDINDNNVATTDCDANGWPIEKKKNNNGSNSNNKNGGGKYQSL